MATFHRHAAVDDVDVFYGEAGEADARQLLLPLGWPSSSQMYRNLTPALTPQYHVVAPDLAGFGYTEAPVRDLVAHRFETITHVVDQFVETPGLGRLALVLFDAGAPMGFHVAMRHPERRPHRRSDRRVPRPRLRLTPVKSRGNHG